MAKHKLTEQEKEQLRGLGEAEKVRRFAHIENEIERTRRDMKASREASMDYIKELEAQRHFLANPTEEET